jgi:hypothetical protein
MSLKIPSHQILWKSIQRFFSYIWNEQRTNGRTDKPSDYNTSSPGIMKAPNKDERA